MDLSAGGGIGQRLRNPTSSPVSFLYRQFRGRANTNTKPISETASLTGGAASGTGKGGIKTESISEIQQRFPGVERRWGRKGRSRKSRVSPLVARQNTRHLELGAPANPQEISESKSFVRRASARPGTTGNTGYSLHGATSSLPESIRGVRRTRGAITSHKRQHVVKQEFGKGFLPRGHPGPGAELRSHRQIKHQLGRQQRPGTTAGIGFGSQHESRPGTTGGLIAGYRPAERNRRNNNKDNRNNSVFFSQGRAQARSQSRAQSRMQTNYHKTRSRSRGSRGRKSLKEPPPRNGFIHAQNENGTYEKETGLFGHNLRSSDKHTARSEPLSTSGGLRKGGWKKLFGVFSHAGERRTAYSVVSQPKENQDSYGLRASLPKHGGMPTDEEANDARPKNSNGSTVLPMFCFGVFDGHGEQGAKVSGLVSKKVPLRVLSSVAAPGGGSYSEGGENDIRASLTAAFSSVQRELKTSVPFDCRNSGSTAVAAVLCGKLLIIANVGDSRCVMGSMKLVKSSGGSFLETRSGERRQLACTVLTNDHKPSRPDEHDRIKKMGGSVEPSKFQGVFMGPPRVWMHPQRVGGLAVSRAMGDTAYAACGVSARPEITKHTVEPETDRFLVLGSDGIFDHLTNEEVVGFVHRELSNGRNPEEAAKNLVLLARGKWREQGHGYVDDVTALIVNLTVVTESLKQTSCI